MNNEKVNILNLTQEELTEFLVSLGLSRKLYDLWYNDIDLSIYSDISPSLSDRIYKLNKNYSDYEEMVASIKSKDYTFTRISRALSHILLNIKKSDMDIYKTNIKYAKLLGFREACLSL